MMTADIHQADVAATEKYKSSVEESLRALAQRLLDIAHHHETGSQNVLDAFFGEGQCVARKPSDEQTIAAARSAIIDSGIWEGT